MDAIFLWLISVFAHKINFSGTLFSDIILPVGEYFRILFVIHTVVLVFPGGI
jgi:hypothetical protein